MAYIEGFVAAVPTANKQAYIEQVRQGEVFFKKFGATRYVECWGDDVPKGVLTDFTKQARKMKPRSFPGSNTPTRRRATRPTSKC